MKTVFLVFITGFLLILMILGSQPITDLSLILILLMLCIIPFLYKRINFYEPYFLFSIIYFIFFGIGAYKQLFDPRDTTRFGLQNSNFRDALVYSILFFIFFLIGYFLIPVSKKIVKKTRTFLYNFKRDIDFNSRKKVIIYFLILNLFSRIIIIYSGSYYHVGAQENLLLTRYIIFSAFITSLDKLNLLIIIISLFSYLRSKDRSFLRYYLLSIVFELSYQLPRGSKESILIPIIISILTYSLFHKIKVKQLIAFSIFIFFFVFPFYSIYRDQMNPHKGLNFQQAIDDYGNYITSFSSDKLSNIENQVFSSRLNYNGILAVVMNGTPGLWNYQNGNTYFGIFTEFIPRFLWTSKPIYNIGHDFGVDYGILAGSFINASVGMSVPGEAYLNFGWFGILVGIFYGLLYRFVYNLFFCSSKPNLLNFVIYFILYYSFIRGDIFSLSLVGAIKNIIFYLILLFPALRKIPNYTSYKKQIAY